MKNIILITLFLSAGYSNECENYLDSFGNTIYNCNCNEDTWHEYYPNMGSCWLEYVDLSDVNLYGVSLNGAYLYGAFLNYANLQNANLEHSNLNEANLEETNLEGANIDWASLEGANLEGAILTGANLFSANLVGANLSYADLSDTDLSGANLSCAILSGTDLNYANLSNTTWDECGAIDENGDGYDDLSYEIGYEAGATSGDLNLDGIHNIIDIVVAVDMLLNP